MFLGELILYIKKNWVIYSPTCWNSPIDSEGIFYGVSSKDFIDYILFNYISRKLHDKILLSINNNGLIPIFISDYTTLSVNSFSDDFRILPLYFEKLSCKDLLMLHSCLVLI